MSLMHTYTPPLVESVSCEDFGLSLLLSGVGKILLTMFRALALILGAELLREVLPELYMKKKERIIMEDTPRQCNSNNNKNYRVHTCN